MSSTRLRRSARDEVTRRLARYPAVALVGPRQCGKTTLATALRGRYFDLEQPQDRLRLDLEWDTLVSGRRLVVLDEAHADPTVFPRLRGAIDADRRRNGRFLLLGSVSPSLMTQVSESLAGRLSLVELAPLSRPELRTDAQTARHWLTGGFPDGGVLRPASFPRWQLDYLSLLAQRDLPAWGLPAKPIVTRRFMDMLAALNGQAWNASQVGAAMGLSYHTVNGYLDFLAGVFLIRRLQPWFANVGKRLVKSPKVYWRDSGLLHALLGITDREALLRHPQVGFSWEGYVIEQIMGSLAARGREATAWHFRTSDQWEIDLLIEAGTERWAIEIKLSSMADPVDMARLNKAADLIGAQRRVLVTQSDRKTGNDTTLSCNVDYLLDRIAHW